MMRLNSKLLSLITYAYSNCYTVDILSENQIVITNHISSPVFSVSIQCSESGEVGIFNLFNDYALSVEQFYQAFAFQNRY